MLSEHLGSEAGHKTLLSFYRDKESTFAGTKTIPNAEGTSRDGSPARSETHLKLVGFSDLVDVGQRASVVRRPRLRQAQLLDLLELHLPVRHRPAWVGVHR